MRTLREIIEAARDGQVPTHEECYWALLVFAELHGFDHRHILEVKERAGEDEFAAKMWADDSQRRYLEALNADPEVWLGPENDPANPEYQELRKAWGKVIDQFLSTMPKQGSDDADLNQTL